MAQSPASVTDPSPPSTPAEYKRKSLPVRGFGQTGRKDAWWVTPLVVVLILSAFLAYAHWSAYNGASYHYGNYLSPFYSPEIWGESHHALLGPKPLWWPAWLIFSPALIILWAPGGFRLTCYYYRGAYYKAFWADPPSCAVGEPRKSYWGERYLPLILQNLHRFFLYFALLFLVFLTYDVYRAMWFVGTDGREHFGIGVGTLVLAVNVVMLSGYALGCHSLRHLIGGKRDRVSASAPGYKAYQCVSCLNRGHMKWAWLSLFTVAFSDIYVRMLSVGIWHDWRIL